MIKLKYLKDRSIVKIKNNNKLECRGRIRLSKVRVSGKNNRLIIGEGSRINQANIIIKGENNTVIIEEKCDLNSLNIIMENKNALISVGAGSIVNKKFNKNSLIAGVLARTIREGVFWNRDEVFKEY